MMSQKFYDKNVCIKKIVIHLKMYIISRRNDFILFYFIDKRNFHLIAIHELCLLGNKLWTRGNKTAVVKLKEH